MKTNHLIQVPLLKMKLLAIFFLIVTAGKETNAQGTTEQNQSASRCGAIADPAARLTCYDSANSVHPNSGTAQSVHWPEFGNGQTSETHGQHEPPIVLRDSGPTRSAPLRAKVVNFSFSRSKRFVVTLDDGQVWRQLGSDSGVAQFNKADENNHVLISRGFLRSFDLKLNDRSDVFKVERIK